MQSETVQLDDLKVIVVYYDNGTLIVEVVQDEQTVLYQELEL